MTLLDRDAALRDLRPDDAPAAAMLDARVMRLPWSVESWRKLIGEPNVFGSAAETSGSLVGLALARAVADEAEILALAVAPDSRRRGIAAALVQQVLGKARRRGAVRVFLEVAAGNRPALALYRRFGFVDAGRRAGYYGTGEAGDALLLVCGPAVDARSDSS